MSAEHSPVPHIATVINNNQPGWTNIIETAPNVTLNVGTKLFDESALFAVGVQMLEYGRAEIEDTNADLVAALKEIQREAESLLDLHPGISQWAIRSALQTVESAIAKAQS